MTNNKQETLSTIVTTETMADQLLIEDLMRKWLVGIGLPHQCESKNEGVAAIYQNIMARESWVLIGNAEFDWQDYFLCQVSAEKYHPKHALEFISWVAGGSLVHNLNETLNTINQLDRAFNDCVKWLPNLCGRNVKYIIGRLEEKAKEFSGKNTYEKCWLNSLKRVSRALATFKTSEIVAAEKAVKEVAESLKDRIRDRKASAEEFEDHIMKIRDAEKRYLLVDPEPVAILPDAKVYTGKLTIELDCEAVQKWASALSWISSREELNKSIGQLLIEVGVMTTENHPFTEGNDGQLTLAKDGFTLGQVNYFMVCKTCGKQGRGNCPDCGTCC